MLASVVSHLTPGSLTLSPVSVLTSKVDRVLVYDRSVLYPDQPVIMQLIQALAFNAGIGLQAIIYTLEHVPYAGRTDLGHGKLLSQKCPKRARFSFRCESGTTAH